MSDEGKWLTLCTVGEDPFQGQLESTVGNKLIGTRVIRIRHLRETGDLQSCHILFVGKGENKRWPTLLANLRAAPVLTVGEAEGFLRAGGMICFHLEENRVRFDINLRAAETAGLKISSQLLLLAASVIGNSGE